jgi:transcriptional regulator with XRE-family HTH domain
MKISEKRRSKKSSGEADIFPEYIRNMRLEKNLSLVKVEKLSGLPVRYLQKIENKNHDAPGLQVLKLLSDTYGISLYSILKNSKISFNDRQI